MLNRLWTILMCVTCKFSTRCCSRKLHCSSKTKFNCSTGLEGYPHRWTTLHQKLQYSDYRSKWITVGRKNPWKSTLISFYWITTATISGVHVLCHCQPSKWSNWCHQPHTNCWLARWEIGLLLYQHGSEDVLSWMHFISQKSFLKLMC